MKGMFPLFHSLGTSPDCHNHRYEYKLGEELIESSLVEKNLEFWWIKSWAWASSVHLQPRRPAASLTASKEGWSAEAHVQLTIHQYTHALFGRAISLHLPACQDSGARSCNWICCCFRTRGSESRTGAISLLPLTWVGFWQSSVLNPAIQHVDEFRFCFLASLLQKRTFVPQKLFLSLTHRHLTFLWVPRGIDNFRESAILFW